MASKTSAPKHRHPWLRRLLLALLLLLLFALGAGVWLVQSERGARLTVSALSTLAPGAFEASDVRGRLAGPLQIGRLIIHAENQQIILQNIRLDWRPAALSRRLVHVTSLQAEHLKFINLIDPEPDPEPATLPETLALPLQLRLDRVQVDGGQIALGAADLIDLNRFSFNLAFDGKRYVLNLTELAAQTKQEGGAFTGRFTGQATLEAAKPYALQARLASSSQAALQQQSFGIDGRLELSGTLERMQASIDFMLDRAPLKGHATLQPFADQVLSDARIAASAIDLAALDAAWPRTAIDLVLTADHIGSGQLTLTNREAGTFDAERLPLANLRGAFRQQDGRFLFDDIEASLGSARQAAGSIRGKGHLAGSALALELALKDVNLQRLDRRMQQTRLAGEIQVKHATGRQTFHIALQEPRGRQTIALQASGILADATLTMEHAELAVGKGRIEAAGHLAFSGDQNFAAQAKASHFRLQDLGQFAQLPNLLVNGDFSLQGRRAPQLNADLRFRIADSLLAGQRLHGEGQAQLRAERLLVPKLLLAAGENRLQVNGELSERGGNLGFSLDAPKLAQLGPQFGGSLEAKGTASGSFTQPRINVVWKAAHASLPGQVQIEAAEGKAEIRIERGKPFALGSAVIDASARGIRSATLQLAALDMKSQLATRADAPLAIEIAAAKLATPQLDVQSAKITVLGTTAKHTIEAVAEENGQSWALTAGGGLLDLARSARWEGFINQLSGKGRYDGRLTAPAPLLVSRERVRLGAARIDANTIALDLEHFTRDASGLSSRGRFERLHVAPFLRFADPDPVLSTDLLLAGDWNVSIADSIDGTIQVRRQGGDVIMKSSTPMALGLRQLDAQIIADQGRLALQFNANGRQLGEIALNAAAVAGSGAQRFTLVPGAPVSGAARINIPSLAWAGPLLAPSLITEGRLRSDIALAGTAAQPRFDGQINGSGLRLYFADQGVDLRGGVLESRFENDTLMISRLSFQSNGGTLTASGPISLGAGNTAADIDLRAQRYALLNNSERRLVLSGQGRIGYRQSRVEATGNFTVDSGFFDIGREDMPQLSDDVVILGQAQKQAGAMAAAVDLKVDFGPGVKLTGRGLDGMLRGAIRILAQPGQALSAQGSLRIENGTFAAYGRSLDIEQGTLRFEGPLNNPLLDILAMRRGQEVEAGVAVRGTVLAPRVTLVSEPPVPDAEKLSWLVLGRGLAGADENDVGSLQAAAGALLSQGAIGAVQSQVASAIGLDELSFGTTQDGLQQRIVRLGRQVSRRLYVGYEHGIDTASSVLHLRYTLSRRLTLEAEAGARSALSLFFNFVFD